MRVLNDRLIHISTGGSRTDVNWPTQELMWSEFAARLSFPVKTPEPMAQYLRLKKTQQDALKDVGGYVGGTLKDGVRKASMVFGRDLVTLDLDAIASGMTDELLGKAARLGCGCVIHSTRKHEPGRPRLRVIIPLARTVSPDEYAPIARKLAELIDLAATDPGSFQASRLMYWPSICSDGQYVYVAHDKPLCDPDGVLAIYDDWHDIASWPRTPSETGLTAPKCAVAKRQDPTTKPGLIGTFCRAYGIRAAIDELLTGIYEPVEAGGDRYTYLPGSTTGGAIVYDDRWLYSHHATDPCGDTLVNSWDLVRIHKFGELDVDTAPNTRNDRIPSFVAMTDWAADLSAVKDELTREIQSRLTHDFSESIQAESAGTINPEDMAWVRELECDVKTGKIKPTRENTSLILLNDPKLKGCFGYDQFRARYTVVAPLPWLYSQPAPRNWVDADDCALRCYLERHYQINAPTNTADTLDEIMHVCAYDAPRGYFEGLRGKWDGVPRVNTLLTDYLGVADEPINQAFIRKTLVACVARQFRPGVKFDYCLVLQGAQGVGKSQFLRTLAGEWFTDNIPRDLADKDARDAVQGKILVELSEFDQYSRNEQGVIKSFLSTEIDEYREAYGRRTSARPRRCVITATVNPDTFLRDDSGGRRFWPVHVDPTAAQTNLIFTRLPEVRDQVWAEAVKMYDNGEVLTLSRDLDLAAKRKSSAHQTVDERASVVEIWLDKLLPADWSGWNADRRRMYWADPEAQKIGDTPRVNVCIKEIWSECFGLPIRSINNIESKAIGSILRELGYEQVSLARDSVYGVARRFSKKNGRNGLL